MSRGPAALSLKTMVPTEEVLFACSQAQHTCPSVLLWTIITSYLVSSMQVTLSSLSNTEQQLEQPILPNTAKCSATIGQFSVCKKHFKEIILVSSFLSFLEQRIRNIDHRIIGNISVFPELKKTSDNKKEHSTPSWEIKIERGPLGSELSPDSLLVIINRGGNEPRRPIALLLAWHTLLISTSPPSLPHYCLL